MARAGLIAFLDDPASAPCSRARCSAGARRAAAAALPRPRQPAASSRTHHVRPGRARPAAPAALRRPPHPQRPRPTPTSRCPRASSSTRRHGRVQGPGQGAEPAAGRSAEARGPGRAPMQTGTRRAACTRIDARRGWGRPRRRTRSSAATSSTRTWPWRKARDQFATPEFVPFLNESKLGNHPEMLRAFYRIGQAISQDGFVPGRGGAGSPANAQPCIPLPT
jgi:hypothetical protein